jgi:hypothetical protein
MIRAGEGGYPILAVAAAFRSRPNFLLFALREAYLI